jgi:putative acetyltransferase
MPITVEQDNLSRAEVCAMIEAHVTELRGASPPGESFALAVDGLRVPEITVWTAWDGTDLCGCGAMKQLNGAEGELKSMRTHAKHLRRGVAQLLLSHIINIARQRGYKQLLLETGTGAAFEAATQLYLHNGFNICGAFGDYAPSEFSVFMVLELR